MHKKMTITLDEAVYEGLWRTIGKRKMSQFIEDLLRPHVVDAIKNVIASALDSVSMPTTPDRRVPQTPGTPDSARTVFKAPGDPILGVPPSGPEVPPLPLPPVTTGSSGSADAADRGAGVDCRSQGSVPRG